MGSLKGSFNGQAQMRPAMETFRETLVEAEMRPWAFAFPHFNLPKPVIFVGSDYKA